MLDNSGGAAPAAPPLHPPALAFAQSLYHTIPYHTICTIPYHTIPSVAVCFANGVSDLQYLNRALDFPVHNIY